MAKIKTIDKIDNQDGNNPNYVELDDFWMRIFRAGEFYPGNLTGDSVVWTEQDLLDSIKNTNNEIEKGDKITINLGHWNRDKACGLISELRYNEGFVEAKIDYLTPEAYADLKAGAYPYRSAEIDSKEKVFVGLALLGADAPAVSGLGAIPYDLTDNFSNKYANLLYFNKEMYKMDIKDTKDIDEKVEKLEPEVIEKPKQPQNEEGTLFPNLEYSKLQNKVIILEKQLELLESKTREVQELSLKKDFASFAKGNPISALNESEVANLLFGISQHPTVFKFKKADDSEGETDTTAMVMQLIAKYSELQNKFSDDIVKSESSSEIFHSSLDAKSQNIQIMDYAKKHDKSYTEAFEILTGE